LLIKETVLNYLEGLDTNDYSRVEKAMHPELAKRVIKKDDVNSEKTLKVEVIIFDISNDIASVKAIQNKFAFFDYIHIGKING
jgi:hypothetical protein